MTDKSWWETLKGDGQIALEKLKALVHEGNVRRIVVVHKNRTVAEFPLTAGVVGAVLAPVLAAIAAIVAMLKDCTIQIERVEPEAGKSAEARGDDPHQQAG